MSRPSSKFQRPRPALGVLECGIVVGHALVREHDLGAVAGRMELHCHQRFRVMRGVRVPGEDELPVAFDDAILAVVALRAARRSASPPQRRRPRAHPLLTVLRAVVARVHPLREALRVQPGVEQLIDGGGMVRLTTILPVSIPAAGTVAALRTAGLCRVSLLAPAFVRRCVS